jgi:A/G-specific adenine glycosylase
VIDEHSSHVVRWQKEHGRNHLPWQHPLDPYPVWLSEIMLQQTQVATVLDYFPRFMQQFPDLAALAAAPLDEVLGLWSGLGYYSRARNLHRCAREVMALHQGGFPRTAAQLQTLAGIGRSTAGAIAALCFGERVAILDGNVKRVLSRVLGFDLDLAVAANERQLWDHATRLLPVTDLKHSMPHYTQGMMDLGASVCTARNPACERCPLALSCVAGRLGQPGKYPVKTRKLKRSSESIWLLWAHSENNSVWLSKRPSPGVWGGLYCFPVFGSRAALEASVPLRAVASLDDLPEFTHVLTHKDLRLHPVRVTVPAASMAGLAGRWMAADEWPRAGLPTPIRNLLLQG